METKLIETISWLKQQPKVSAKILNTLVHLVYALESDTIYVKVFSVEYPDKVDEVYSGLIRPLQAYKNIAIKEMLKKNNHYNFTEEEREVFNAMLIQIMAKYRNEETLEQN